MKPYNRFLPEQRMAAFMWLKQEIAAGRRHNARRCMCCGQDRGILDLHSEDYSEPYGAHIGRYELCWTCHMVWHSRHRCPNGVAAYIRLTTAGFQAQPVYRKSFADLDALLASPAESVEQSGAAYAGGWERMNAEAALVTGVDWLLRVR